MESSKIQKIKAVFLNALLGAVVLFFLFEATLQIKPYAEFADSLDNLKLAYNLAKYEQFSSDNIHGESTTVQSDTLDFFAPGSSVPVSSESARPTALREPLPIFITSFIINHVGYLSKQPNVQSLNTGKATVLIKLQNIAWLFFIFLGLSIVLKKIFHHSSVYYLGASGALIALISHYLSPRMYASLLTEMLAAAIMVWFLVFFLSAIHTNKTRFFVLSGLMYGLLILTKAAFLYIGIVFFSALLIWLIYTRRRFNHIKQFGWMLLLCALVVSPWIVRNKLALDFAGITSRASDVLMVRAEKNLMTPLEVQGALSYYAPAFWQKPISKHFGFYQEDLEPNGRLARLVRGHPQDKLARSQLNTNHAISFYYRGTTKAFKARMEAYKNKQSILAADKRISKEALQMMLQHPVAHLKATFIFAYRGLFVPKSDAFTVAGFFATLLFLIAGFIKKNETWVALFLLPTLCFGFYAFLTHFIPRYSDPLIPFWILGLVLFFTKILQCFVNTFFKRSPQTSQPISSGY